MCSRVYPPLQRMGVHTIKSGRRFGYQLLKSMHLDDVNADPRREDGAVARPVNVSLCYLYCQIDADVVEVFVRGIVEIVSDVRDQEAAVHAAADYILAAVRGRECGRMRKISQLIGQSKTERDRLTYVPYLLAQPFCSFVSTASKEILTL